MMNRISTQCQLDSGEFLRFNRLVKPVALMVINVTKRDFLERLWNENDALRHLIYRHHPNLDWADDPERRGRENAAAIAAHIAPVADLFTHIVDNNEFIYDENHSPPERIDAADRYIAAFIEEAAKHGFGVCWGNFNVGHFGPQFVDQFKRALDASSATSITVCPCFHSYSWPTLDTSPQYLVNRYKTIMEPVRERYPNMQCALTELGVDSGVIGEGHKGWRLTREDLAEAAALYCDGLSWINSDLDDYVLFALIFGCGMYGDWASMDIANSPVIECVAALPQPEPPPEEPPPEEKPPMSDDIRIFDMNGNEKDLAWAKAKYGVEFRRAEVSAGAKVFRLVELWEKTGHSALITQVLNEDGQPIDKQDVAFYWPGAPDPPDPPTDVYDHDWHDNFVHGPTNVNGDVGPGMGRGAYHGEGEGGPHAVWVRDPGVPSDICEKLGMLAGTFHDHLDQKFQRMTAGAEEPGNGNGGELVEIARIVETGQDSAMLYVAYPDSIAFNTDVEAGITGSDLDLDTAPLDKFTHDGVEYARGGVCCNYDGTGPREYWIRAFDLETQEDVTPTVKATFDPIPDYRHVTAVFDYESGGNGNGEEPPPSGSKAEAYQLMADGEALIAAGHDKKAQAHKILAEL